VNLNHITLLDALVILRERYSFKPRCVLTGLPTFEPHEVDIHREILKRGLLETVHHLGVVSLSELKYLYLNAKALVFPGLLEGFGIPVLEAMTVGCPDGGSEIMPKRESTHLRMPARYR